LNLGWKPNTKQKRLQMFFLCICSAGSGDSRSTSLVINAMERTASMTLRDDTRLKYQAKAKELGATFLGQGTGQSVLLKMECGHDRLFPISTFIQHGRLKCKVCWANDKIIEHKAAIKELEKVENDQ
jgi:hypothetical protein